jgi:uncharacterized protein (DUF488 family)
MDVFTIGFAKKSAKDFFNLLQKNNIEYIIDVRLNSKGQLAGFTKQDDLSFFLDRLLNCKYVQIKTLAPTKELLSQYRKSNDWNEYANNFELLMDERKIPFALNKELFEKSICCLLCSEARPEKCHRRLVAERMAKYWPNVKVCHII